MSTLEDPIQKKNKYYNCYYDIIILRYLKIDNFMWTIDMNSIIKNRDNKLKLQIILKSVMIY